tara:strand:+ start:2642 stop:2887 length:246 start_codon:yes stop_codon:yes gene_type:complete
MEANITLDTFKDLDINNIKVDVIKFQKMIFLYNAIEQGWSVKKHDDSYIFKKNHEGKKEVFENSYLLKFMKSSLDINKIFS